MEAPWTLRNAPEVLLAYSQTLATCQSACNGSSLLSIQYLGEQVLNKVLLALRPLLDVLQHNRYLFQKPVPLLSSVTNLSCTMERSLSIAGFNSLPKTCRYHSDRCGPSQPEAGSLSCSDIQRVAFTLGARSSKHLQCGLLRSLSVTATITRDFLFPPLLSEEY